MLFFVCGDVLLLWDPGVGRGGVEEVGGGGEDGRGGRGGGGVEGVGEGEKRRCPPASAEDR